jgi:L-aminopeptidase/D-esterase-like protein
VHYLEERGIGFDVGVARVPIVPAAILFDLGLGSAAIRPDPAMGYQACLNASDAPPAEGNVGAGTGCSVGKALGIQQAMKSGVGNAAIEIGAGVMVAALVAVNAFGDIIDPASGQIVAGARRKAGEIAGGAHSLFADTLQIFKQLGGNPLTGFRRPENTVIGVVVTNARLNKEQTNKMAQMAQDGLARSVRPSHTMLDGDTLFALATGEHDADVNIVGAFAAEAVAQAILRAVRAARSAGGLPAIMDLHNEL